jgi:hypothetical protein
MNKYLGEDRQNDAAQMVTSAGMIMTSLMRRVEAGSPQNWHDQCLSLPDEFDESIMQ